MFWFGGVSIPTTYNASRQISINKVLQESNTVCFAECQNVVNNITLVINNGSQMGDIKITQQCDSNSLCSIKNSFETVSIQTLESYQFAESKGTGICPFKTACAPMATNINEQYLFNSTSQVFNTVCIADAQSSATNVLVFVNDNSSVGGFEIEQVGQATADCSLDNTARAYSSQTSKTEQVAIAGKGFGVLVLILLITALIVGIVFYFNTSLKKEELRATNELLIAQIESGRSDLAETVFLAKNPDYAPFFEAAKQDNKTATATAALLNKDFGIPVEDAYRMIKGVTSPPSLSSSLPLPNEINTGMISSGIIPEITNVI